MGVFTNQLPTMFRSGEGMYASTTSLSRSKHKRMIGKNALLTTCNMRTYNMRYANMQRLIPVPIGLSEGEHECTKVLQKLGTKQNSVGVKKIKKKCNTRRMSQRRKRTRGEKKERKEKKERRRVGWAGTRKEER